MDERRFSRISEAVSTSSIRAIREIRGRSFPRICAGRTRNLTPRRQVTHAALHIEHYPANSARRLKDVPLDRTQAALAMGTLAAAISIPAVPAAAGS
jgi:hypothetical protein